MLRFPATKAKLDPLAAAMRIFGLIKDEMALVEEEFGRQASSNIQVINYLGEYLRASGGKRVRPALLLLANRAVGGDAGSHSAVKLATVMEMLHTATLVHDDIIDNADTRRNRPSVNAKFGNQAAVLMGDWLYMSAFETALEERRLEILDILTTLTRMMTEGELIQLTVLGSAQITEEEYFDILRRKTAFLFSACCEIGALLGGSGDEQREGLRDYGMNLGIAFQLADDVLDFTADEGKLGKKAGADLLEGKLTLPLITLLKRDPSMMTIVEGVMRDGDIGTEGRTRIQERMKELETIEETKETAGRYAAAARKNLEVLPRSEYRTALEEIPGYMIERDK